MSETTYEDKETSNAKKTINKQYISTVLKKTCFILMTVASSAAVLFFEKIHPTFRSTLDGTGTGTRPAAYRYKVRNRTALLGSIAGNGIMSFLKKTSLMM
jgi:hypothetical protein